MIAAAVRADHLQDKGVVVRETRYVLATSSTGLELRAIDYARSLRRLEAWRRQVAQLFQERCDLVLTPTMPCTAPPIEPDHDAIAVSTRLSRFTWLWPAAGAPALSVPCGFDAHGLPIRMQLAGPRWSEPLLLRLGQAYQPVSDWHGRRPAPGDRDSQQRLNGGRR